MSNLAFSDAADYPLRRDLRRRLALVPASVATPIPLPVDVAPCQQSAPIGPEGFRRGTLWAVAVAVGLHLAVVLYLQQPAPELPVQPPEIPPMTVELSVPREALPPPPPEQKRPPPPVPKQPAAQQPAQPVAVPQPVAEPVAARPVPVQELPPPQRPQPEPERVSQPEAFAGYLRNPAPAYPTFAQEQGWEGHVLLRVHVLASGRADSVDVKQGSGRKVLDDAAVRTVQRWTFVPAKRGEVAVDGWVDVPIDFKLN